jgi:hypothetical protein
MAARGADEDPSISVAYSLRTSKKFGLFGKFGENSATEFVRSFLCFAVAEISVPYMHMFFTMAETKTFVFHSREKRKVPKI